MDVTYYFDLNGHNYKITFVQDRKDIKNDTYFVDFSVWDESHYSFSISFGDGRLVFDKVMTYIKEFEANTFKIRPSSDSRYRLFRIWLKSYVNDFNIQQYKGYYDKQNFLLIKKSNESLLIKKFKDFNIPRKI